MPQIWGASVRLLSILASRLELLVEIAKATGNIVLRSHAIVTTGRFGTIRLQLGDSAPSAYNWDVRSAQEGTAMSQEGQSGPCQLHQFSPAAQTGCSWERSGSCRLLRRSKQSTAVVMDHLPVITAFSALPGTSFCQLLRQGAHGSAQVLAGCSDGANIRQPWSWITCR